MNKANLVEFIVKDTNVSKTDASAMIDSFIKAVSHALSSGDSVTLIGFGSFHAVKRAARTARNPQTGEMIEVPVTTSPKFKAGKSLKEIVSGKKNTAKKTATKSSTAKKKK